MKNFRISWTSLFALAALWPAQTMAQTRPEPTIDDNVPAITAAEALAADAVLYSEAYGVGFDEAVRRMVIMNSEFDLSEDGMAENAGTYFVNGPEFKIVAKVKGARRQDRAETRKVRVRGPRSAGRRAAL